jgi:purine-binding chemotaxis protein CheW
MVFYRFLGIDMEMASVETKQSDPLMRWVTFRLGGEKYGINVMRVQEILCVTEITPVPGAYSYVLGMINLRGNVVTVIDTRNRFGLMSKPADDDSRIVIIEAEAYIIGFLVDSVAEVIEMRASEIEISPNFGHDETSKYIQGVTVRNNELLILVDLNKLLNDDVVAELDF